MVTSTSVPASSPVASSGMMTYPSAAVSTDSSADSPNTGVATPCATRTWTTSRRPGADGRGRGRRGRTAGSGGGGGEPAHTRAPGGDAALAHVQAAGRGRQVAGQPGADRGFGRRGGAPADQAHQGDAEQPEDHQRGARVAGQPDDRDAVALGQQGGLARLDREAV